MHCIKPFLKYLIVIIENTWPAESQKSTTWLYKRLKRTNIYNFSINVSLVLKECECICALCNGFKIFHQEAFNKSSFLHELYSFCRYLVFPTAESPKRITLMGSFFFCVVVIEFAQQPFLSDLGGKSFRYGQMVKCSKSYVLRNTCDL